MAQKENIKVMKDKELDLNEENLKFIEKLGIYYENYGIPRIGGYL